MSDDFSDPVTEEARLFVYHSLMGQPFGETSDDEELAGELRLLPKREEGETDPAWSLPATYPPQFIASAFARKARRAASRTERRGGEKPFVDFSSARPAASVS